MSLIYHIKARNLWQKLGKQKFRGNIKPHGENPQKSFTFRCGARGGVKMTGRGKRGGKFKTVVLVVPV